MPPATIARYSLFDRVIHVSGDAACDDHALLFV